MRYTMKIFILIVSAVAMNRAHAVRYQEEKFNAFFGFITNRMHPIDRAYFKVVIQNIDGFSSGQMEPLRNFLQFHAIPLEIMYTIQGQLCKLHLLRSKERRVEASITEQLLQLSQRVYVGAQSLTDLD